MTNENSLPSAAFPILPATLGPLGPGALCSGFKIHSDCRRFVRKRLSETA